MVWGRFRKALDGEQFGALLVSGIGVALAGLSLWYLFALRALYVGDLTTSGDELFLVGIEAALLGAFSAVLIYAGYWLVSSPFEAHRTWWASLWTLIGLAGIAAVVTLAISLQLVRGHTPPRPTLVQTMLLATGGGAVAGLLIGISTIRESAEAERAHRQRETLLFVNELLRHNVLNGIQVIKGNTALLAEEIAEIDDDTEPRLDAIEERSDRIVDLVQNVRVLMASISGETSLRPIELEATLGEAVEATKRVYPDAEIDVEVPPHCVVADELLEAVFENVLDNAVKHNDADTPQVTVTATASGETVGVRIADNGPGIAPIERQRYLEAGENDETRIGLYLATTLVERYGGTIDISANAPRGTAVLVELQLSDGESVAR